MTETDVWLHEWRLVPAAAAAWLVAWWAVGADAGAVLRVGAGMLVCATVPLSVAALRRLRGGAPGRASRVLVPALVAAAVVCLLVAPQLDRRAALDGVADGPAATLVVGVAGDPVSGRGTQPWQREQVRLAVVVEQVSTPDGARSVRVPALVHGDARWAELDWGERVRVVARVRPAEAGARAAVHLSPGSAPVVLERAAWPWRAADRLREGLVAAARGPDGVAPDDGAALLPGLVVGDTGPMPAELADGMRRAGLAHLTAVSGANVTIVCGGVLLVCLLLGLHRAVAVGLAALALVALVVVARPEPSVLRAAAMGCVGLLGVVVGRRGGGLSALAVAVLAVLLADPWLARAPGLRLSVAATAALVLLAGPWARALGRVAPRWAATTLAVPAAAQAGVAPLLVGLDPNLQPWALPANVLAAPAVAPATVVGVVAALVSLAHPGAAAWLALPATWCAAWITGVARLVADLPLAALPWPAGPPGAAATLLVVLVAVAVAALVLRLLPDLREDGRAWARWRLHATNGGTAGGFDVRPVTAVVLVLAVMVVAARPGPPLGLENHGRHLLPWLADTAPPPDWTVVVCDVGQGEALLLRAGPAAAVVVDTGPEPATLTRCLDRASVRTVPLLVLTHLHADHVGGLAALDRALVDRVWTPAADQPAESAAALAEWLAGGPERERVAGGTRSAAGQVTVEVLWPPPEASPPGPAADSQAVNDGGLVVRLDVDGVRVLVLGDVGADVQARLLKRPEALRADVTTVAHHGSVDQLPALYEAVGARVAVASAGRDNGYGHPSRRALETAGATGAVVLSTLVHGEVSIRAVREGTGAVLRVSTARAPRRGQRRAAVGRGPGTPADVPA